MKYNIEKNIAYIKERVPNDRLKQYNKQIRAEVIDEALNYCNSNNDDKEECWSCCLSVWENGKFKGCYLEELKEQK